MRDDHKAFRSLGVHLVVVTRHDAKEMLKYWQKEKLPYIGVPDPEGVFTSAYGQQWKLFRLGRMPSQFVVDCRGTIAFAHYASSMSDIPANKKMLEVLRRLKCPGRDGVKKPSSQQTAP